MEEPNAPKPITRHKKSLQLWSLWLILVFTARHVPVLGETMPLQSRPFYPLKVRALLSAKSPVYRPARCFLTTASQTRVANLKNSGEES